MLPEENLAHLLISKNLKISTVESCTGGLLSSVLTDISGSSKYITLNLITYSNEAKQKILKVAPEILKQYGAVSEQCAEAMATGLFALTDSDICVSTTGIAGPTGGSSEKPVGLMFSTIYSSTKTKTYKIRHSSNLSRRNLKKEFVNSVIKNIIEFIRENY